MAKKTDDFYFDNFVQGISVSCDAARLLREILLNFDVDHLPAQQKAIHLLEHKGDEVRHTLVAEVAHAFITPLERDDLITLSQSIDNVTDTIEDILLQIYITGISQIRSDALVFAELLLKCTEATRQMLQEFRNFKKSKKLNEFIILINHVEEEGDDMYVSCMRRIHTELKDPMQVLAWREVYNFFEKCFDACEDVADIVESITIDNT